MDFLPESLLHALEGVPGFDRQSFVHEHAAGNQVVSVRYNPAKEAALTLRRDPALRRVPWCSNGYYLPARPSFTLDPLLHAGVYYVQEASSMFLEQALCQTLDLGRPLRVLDLCAAPGGKSTLIQSLIAADSLLVSNEVIKARAAVLVENLSKWGGANTIATNNDPRDFGRLQGFFDAVVVDAPCSGSGLFRRDPGAVEQWSPQAVTACSLRQRRILADALPALKEGGVLIYSTCSYSTEENEAVCDWLLEDFGMETLSLQIDPAWHIVESLSPQRQAYGYRFFPGKVEGEGFFLACFRLVAAHPTPSAPALRKKGVLVPATRAQVQLASPWLQQPDACSIFAHEEDLLVFPRRLEEELMAVNGNLYTKKAGVQAGRPAKKEIIPAHELAVSVVASQSLAAVSLNREEALQYLRKEEVTLSLDGRGWCLAQYFGVSLGWMKLLGNRINNYYPKEWRIRKSENK